jgi:hypothetical protein
MPRDNVKGTSFLGLTLEKHEEREFKKILKTKDKSGKQVLRMLVRKIIKGEIEL